jgi:hypothetical protein
MSPITADQLVPMEANSGVASEPHRGESLTFGQNPEIRQVNNAGKTIALSPAKMNINLITQWANDKMYALLYKERGETSADGAPGR